MEFVPYNDPVFLTWSVFVALVAIAFFISIPLLLNRYKQWKLLKCIQKLGVVSLHNCVIPDGLGGTVYLEHAVMRPDGIGVFFVKCYQGVIFAADNIDSWTQVVGKRTYKFPNPLPELEAALMAVRALIPGVPVYGRILVLPGAKFPKGKPERVRLLTEAAQKEQSNTESQVAAHIESAWKKLEKSAQHAEIEPNPVFIGHSQSAMKQRKILSSVVLMLALGWLVWRFAT